MAQPRQPRDRGDFPIAIICALPLEATAVTYQFDSFWGETGNMFGQAPGDLNAYTQGVIGLHNVVLAYPPYMGKGSAAGVAASIGSSFLGIELALVVGICGGVPTGTGGEEIRLGDVVISDGIIEYDFGRQYSDKFVRKNTLLDSLGRPNPKIRALFNKLKDDWSARRLRSNTSKYLIDLQKKSDRYRHPGVETDKLFAPTYRHKHQDFLACNICSKCAKKEDEVCSAALDLSCSDLKCNENNLVSRSRPPKAHESTSTREHTIHYGLIASGDNVMKSGEDRDAIAAREGVIAFEMEGAGVWDKLPCVVIKGVCDYADSHKNKDWQNYAAGAAASCVKAFLKEWISTDSPSHSITSPNNFVQSHAADIAAQSTNLENNKLDCLRSLSFSEIDVREVTINLPHHDTCNWLFKTPEFWKWRYRKDLSSHNGILWIKGNPGAGKSTLMRHTLLYCRETLKDHVIAAYFFTARGNILEKSFLGMLRSLLYQLLDQDRVMCERFIPLFLEKQKKHGKEWEWRIGDLKSFLLSEMTRPQRKPFILLIDALDECSDSEARAVVSFLESLSVTAASSNFVLKTCLSSRYYPNIGIERSLELRVEKEEGHDQDIAKYVQYKLRVRDKVIEQELLRKAEHIFMWVVLVVEMLNKAFDDGDVTAMHEKLREIPSDLDEVFFTLLSKDNPKKQETTLILQWVLFAKRLLKPEELYFAVLVGAREKGVGAWNRSNETPEMIKRYITSTSKGLVEVRTGKLETVQFIHESVNDFLLRNKRLQTLDPMLEPHAIGSSHDRLAACCMSYIMIEDIKPSAEDIFDTERKKFKGLVAFNYPFLEYAATYVLYHADRALAGGVTQEALIQRLQEQHREFKRLRNFHDFFQYHFESHIVDADLLYAASLYGYFDLVQVVLKMGSGINAQGGYYGNALQAALHGRNEAVVALLLEKGAYVNAQGGYYGNALQAALRRGNEAIVALLLEKGADVNMQGGHCGNALQAASALKREAVVVLLLKKGADVNMQGGEYGNALQAASACGEEAILALLLEKGADINAQGGYYGNALQAASAGEHEAIVAILLEKGADINAQGGKYGNALQAASANGNEAVVALLLKKGADVNAQGGEYGSALQAASADGKKAIVSLLLEKGANVNAQGGPYGNALQAASVYGSEAIVSLLLEKGANVNAQGGFYGNALQAASANEREAIVHLLLEAGAEPLTNTESAAQTRGVETRTRRKRKRSVGGG